MLHSITAKASSKIGTPDFPISYFMLLNLSFPYFPANLSEISLSFLLSKLTETFLLSIKHHEMQNLLDIATMISGGFNDIDVKALTVIPPGVPFNIVATTVTP